MNLLRYVIFSCLVLFCLAGMQTQRPTLYLIGDSTIRNGSGKGVDGLWGWGSVIGEYFDTSRIHIDNQAIGGRSSRTFLTEDRWDKIKAKLKPGDFVLLQFGHNDAGAINDTSRARGTIRGIGDETVEIDNKLTKKHEIVHSYGWYIRQYVADTKASGAVPIVCSLVPRNVWKDNKVVRASDNYAQWAAQIAKAEGAFFIDLNENIAHQYEAGFTEETLKAAFFPVDHTHTNLAGAQFNARSVTEGLRQLKNCPLQPYLKSQKR
ncbi:rhamnogalacturonan acetylesterase [Spirosoma sp. BT702]|uniref:Rhamnogalacturonan acetylesterase n=1 Tax=Spirosoma profusum TaxID=2771354 RepID=A0A927AW59_9BACT|nr:rhamnogalacturonan acetylesterase [Spirosoma profusum]MBD2705469.1 rhamnogalacturonan acetylesterase [Spirosoma profusum]